MIVAVFFDCWDDWGFVSLHGLHDRDTFELHWNPGDTTSLCFLPFVDIRAAICFTSEAVYYPNEGKEDREEGNKAITGT